MNDQAQVQRYYGDQRYRLKFWIRVEDTEPFTNRDLVSIAHVIDWSTRSVTRDIVLGVGPHLQLEPEELRALRRGLDKLPAASFDSGEIVEFRRGSWQLVFDLPDTAVVLLLLYLLRITIGRDIETAWSGSRASARFRKVVTASIPGAMRAAAQALHLGFRRSGRLGSRHVVDSVEVTGAERGREIRVVIVARKSAVVRSQHQIDE